MPSLWDDAHAPSMRLPKVREKLSSLVRRGSSKRKQATAAGPNGVTFNAPVLDVNLERVKSLRLADGWLEDASSPPSPKRRRSRGREEARESEQRKSDQEKKRYSATPIADLFSMSTDQLASTLETISRKPATTPAPSVTAPSPWTVAPPSTTTTPAAGDAASSSKSDRRDASAEASVTQEPQPIRISLRHSTVMDAVVVPEVRLSTESRRRSAMAWSNNALVNTPNSSSTQDKVSDGASQRHAVRQVNLMRSVGPNTTGLRVSNGGGSTTGSGSGSGAVENMKRNSTTSISAAIELQLSHRPPISEIKTTLATPRNASTPTPISTTTPTSSMENRRRSWQPATPLSAVAPSAQGSMGPPPRRTTSTRPPSAALTSSRLAWIRELENKSSSPSSSGTADIQKLGLKSSSGVAGKLAMFEHIQKQKQPSQPTLSRSNSTASSRMADSVFAGYSAASPSLSHVGDGLPSTARTSMDSTRSMPHGSQRSSAVLAYYDEEFRERMEGVAGGLAHQLDKNGKDSTDHAGLGPRKVTARLAEVERERTVKEAQPAAGAAVSETAEKKQDELVAEEQTTTPAPADAAISSGDVEPANAKASGAADPADAGEEPLSAAVSSEEPTAVKADQVEAVDRDSSKDQPSETRDEPAATATEETTSADVAEGEEEDVEAAKEPSLSRECPETREVEKKDKGEVIVLSQDAVAEGSVKEVLAAEVCEEKKAEVPVVDEQAEAQASVVPIVKTQIAEAATGV